MSLSGMAKHQDWIMIAGCVATALAVVALVALLSA